MTRNRFHEITCKIHFTDKKTPTVASNGFVDWFHGVREMLDAFNNHYDRNYVASWISCLDESMSSWLSKYCPGFMVCHTSLTLLAMNTTQLPMAMVANQ